jgi:hypothetical protein
MVKLSSDAFLPFLLLLVVVSAAVLTAQPPTPTQEGLVYGTADGQALTMDYYAPAGCGLHPIVILIHGGAAPKQSRAS